MAEQHEAFVIFVKSRKFPVSVREFELNSMEINGVILRTKHNFVIYERRLDDRQKILLQYAKELARESGYRLHVIDLSNKNIFGRLLGRLLRNQIPSVALPSSRFVGVEDEMNTRKQERPMTVEARLRTREGRQGIRE